MSDTQGKKPKVSSALSPSAQHLSQHLPQHLEDACHGFDSHPVHGRKEKGKKALLLALGITLCFMVLEVIGGILSNSLALLSDAAHMLTDSGAMLLSLFAYWMARRPGTKTMSFGYHRAEILGALGSGLLIWLLVGGLIYEALTRLNNPPEVKGPLMFMIAAIGLGANLISMKLLHSSKHESLNMKAAYTHVIADALGSVSALIAGLVIWYTGWQLIDPIVTLLFAVIILGSSWSLVRDSVSVLMLSFPAGLNPDDLRVDLLKITGVQAAHDLHVWSVTAGKPALSVHLVTQQDGTQAQILKETNALLQKKYGIQHTTIQVELEAEFDPSHCLDCEQDLNPNQENAN